LDANSGGNKPKKGYTEEFNRSVVDHWCHSGKTAGQVAEEFGVTVWNVRYHMIEELSRNHAVRDLCQLLGVTRSSYCAWRRGWERARARENRELTE
jgi:transposase-like protein